MALDGPIPYGHGHNLVTELDVRAVVVTGLHALVSDEEAIRSIIRRSDALAFGSQERWEREMRRAVLDLLSPDGDRYVQVGVGYPTPEIRLPFVSIVKESGGENDAEAVCGDRLSESRSDIVGEWTPGPSLDGLPLWPLPDGTSPPVPPQIDTVQPIGGGYRSTLQVACWSVSPEESILLHSMVWWTLFRGKGELVDAGVHEVRLSDSGFVPDERMDPRVGYVPTIRVDLSSTYQQLRRTRAVPGVVILTNQFTN